MLVCLCMCPCVLLTLSCRGKPPPPHTHKKFQLGHCPGRTLDVILAGHCLGGTLSRLPHTHTHTHTHTHRENFNLDVVWVRHWLDIIWVNPPPQLGHCRGRKMSWWDIAQVTPTHRSLWKHRSGFCRSWLFGFICLGSAQHWSFSKK